MAVEQTDLNGLGAIKISDEVISKVSEIALEDIEGVLGLADSSKNFGFGIKTSGKGVRAEMKDNFVIVNIDVVMQYGVNILEVAWEIQGKIKKAVESMTGLVVQSVNVQVKDVKVPDDAPKNEPEPQPEEQVETTEENE